MNSSIIPEKRPYRSNKEPGRVTTVHVPHRVDNWLKNRGMSLAGLVAVAPDHIEELIPLRLEHERVLSNVTKLQAKLTEVMTERDTLADFKRETIKRWRLKEQQ